MTLLKFPETIAKFYITSLAICIDDSDCPKSPCSGPDEVPSCRFWDWMNVEGLFLLIVLGYEGSPGDHPYSGRATTQVRETSHSYPKL
ncbi:hypothetical protein MTR_4g063655 [Medicago truncatula]|uniref:Uncharacterized protein n=1 Tax=Medicago truncatula TaxID=3880 RepID=A0A072UK87_MEDTR|nr:hypothetical protein MTR_4g063655 [Medicago truncatula]